MDETREFPSRLLWALRPGLDEGVPAVDDFTRRTRDEQSARGLDVRVTGRRRGRERGGFLGWGGIELGPSLPTPI